MGVYGKDTTDAEYKAAREKLESKMNAVAYTVLSKGKTYTVANTSNEGDFADDGAKLTDGSKGNSDGGTSKFVGFKNAEVVVDLGSAQSANIFKIYMTGGDWGIEIPTAEQLHMTVSVSDDKVNFTPVATTNSFTKSGIKNGNWESLTLTASPASAVSARYVKFNVSSDAPNNYVWLDEVEVANGDPLLANKVYITDANRRVNSGECIMFTSGFGEITVDNGGIAWTCNAVAKWDASKGGYVINSISTGTGSNTPSIKLADDEILLAAHNWESGVTDGSAVAGSAANFATLYSAKVGEVITLDGVTINQTAYVTVASYANVHTQDSSSAGGTHTHVPVEVTCLGGQSCLTCGELIAQPLILTGIAV